MRFISNGDYIFPFQFTSYWSQHVYLWSFQHGAANPDGIMRLPGRLLDLLVFAVFGNIGIGYFYVVSCMVVAFLAFWWFCRAFLEVQRLSTQLLGSLFFTLNPIFLGNLSKVGLILAAAMLPVALAAIKLGFEKRRFSYFLLLVAALNISLLHPFTFSVNLLGAGIYAIYMARKHGTFVRDNLPKFGLVVLAALLLNAYLILPLASLGTVDKSALSDTANTQVVDYTSLVDIANTGDIFTGLSLSKGVLKDYNFYGARSWPFYFLGVFAFYAIMFGVYVRVGQRAKPDERRRFVIALAVFLVLLALSTATFLHADALIKFMISLPGGWMFRSPLKWQLYMPLALFTALVIALKYLRKGPSLKLVYTGLLCTFVLMNAYLFVQIYKRLLVPRSLVYFGALANMPLEGKTLLFVNSNACMAFARDNPGVATELNQVFISKNVQVKHAESGSIDTVAVGQYDYVLGCRESLDTSMLTKRYSFIPTQTFAAKTYELYQNSKPADYVSVVNQSFALDNAVALSGKYSFASNEFGARLPFIEAAAKKPAIGLQDVFDALSPASIHDGALMTSLKPSQPGDQELYLTHTAPMYYTATGNNIVVSNVPSKGTRPVPAGPLKLNVAEGQTINLSYADANYSYKNTVANGSLEQGLWERKVGDCNNYDNEPAIAMRLNTNMHSDGKQSLELESKKHIACTGLQDIPVKEGEHYLLHFDYASKGGRYAGYFAGFNNTDATSSGQRLPGNDGSWTAYTTELVVPPGATSLKLLFYAYSDNAPGKTGKAHYDNVSVTRIPDVKNHFFVVSKHEQLNTPAPASSYTVLNPTKTMVTIQSAKAPLYVTSKESYDRLWRLRLDDGAHGLPNLFSSNATSIKNENHLRMNGAMNGWYIDPQRLCQSAPAGCIANADGTYTIHLVMEFSPQRWFYAGCLVSIVTAAATVLYVVYDIRRGRGAAA
ncbi:MAG TPA: hypothetical protein VGO07_04785 [Candidatus Saccharimonadales bacterium]|nr:hypothetical protein [Candidatus Saccharimonadales bacterium]